MYSVTAPLIGALIVFMNAVNSRLALHTGYITAAVVVHVVGLIAISLIVRIRKEDAVPDRVSFIYYLGGVVGVGTVFASNYAYVTLGATLAAALALLGQSLFSLFADATGFLGRRKFPLSVRNIPGIALSLAGVAIMTGWMRSPIPACLAALAAGICPGLSFVLNSELGRRKGIFKSAQWNYRTGLVSTLFIVLLLRLSPGTAIKAISEAGPFLALGGGLMGVVMIAAMNFIYPRIPAFSATLLLFSGQACTGMVIDYFTLGVLETKKLIGTCVVVMGLFLNAILTARKSEA